jgi:uncharacterized membrane protein
MTPEERANRIGDRFIEDFRSKVPAEQTIAFIADQIREALEDAEKEWTGVRSCRDCAAEAYEDAAKIAEKFNHSNLAGLLRARKDEVCK